MDSKITPLTRQPSFLYWQDTNNESATVLVVTDSPIERGVARLVLATRYGMQDIELSERDARYIVEALQERLP